MQYSISKQNWPKKLMTEAGVTVQSLHDTIFPSLIHDKAITKRIIKLLSLPDTSVSTKRIQEWNYKVWKTIKSQSSLTCWLGHQSIEVLFESNKEVKKTRVISVVNCIITSKVGISWIILDFWCNGNFRKINKIFLG